MCMYSIRWRSGGIKRADVAVASTQRDATRGDPIPSGTRTRNYRPCSKAIFLFRDPGPVPKERLRTTDNGQRTTDDGRRTADDGRKLVLERTENGEREAFFRIYLVFH